MKNNINIRIEKQTKNEFSGTCKALGVQMSDVLRGFILKVNSLSLQEAESLFKGLKHQAKKQNSFKIDTRSL